MALATAAKLQTQLQSCRRRGTIFRGPASSQGPIVTLILASIDSALDKQPWINEAISESRYPQIHWPQTVLHPSRTSLVSSCTNTQGEFWRQCSTEYRRTMQQLVPCIPPPPCPGRGSPTCFFRAALACPSSDSPKVPADLPLIRLTSKPGRNQQVPTRPNFAVSEPGTFDMVPLCVERHRGWHLLVVRSSWTIYVRVELFDPRNFG